MLRIERVCLAASLVFACWPAAALAQFGGGVAEMAALHGANKQAISADGTSTVQRKPTQLRLYVQLTAKGKTLKDALAKLKERQEAATAQLETLKADKKSIVFGAPSLSNVQSARKRQIEAMVRAQMQSRGKKVPKGLQTPQTVTVTSTLVAGWPLESQSHEELLLMVQDIQDKINAADLAGSKDAEKLSPEEEEFEEEASQMANQFGNEETAQPGQPQFVFAAVLPKQDREKAMTEAVAKAKQQAADLAKAAGVELGPLVGLAGSCTGQTAFDGGFQSYDPTGRSEFLRQMLAKETGGDSDGKQDETVGVDPGELRFHCSVTALFQFGK